MSTSIIKIFPKAMNFKVPICDIEISTYLSLSSQHVNIIIYNTFYVTHYDFSSKISILIQIWHKYYRKTISLL